MELLNNETQNTEESNMVCDGLFCTSCGEIYNVSRVTHLCEICSRDAHLNKRENGISLNLLKLLKDRLEDVYKDCSIVEKRNRTNYVKLISLLRQDNNSNKFYILLHNNELTLAKLETDDEGYVYYFFFNKNKGNFDVNRHNDEDLSLRFSEMVKSKEAMEFINPLNDKICSIQNLIFKICMSISDIVEETDSFYFVARQGNKLFFEDKASDYRFTITVDIYDNKYVLSIPKIELNKTITYIDLFNLKEIIEGLLKENEN